MFSSTTYLRTNPLNSISISRAVRGRPGSLKRAVLKILSAKFTQPDSLECPRVSTRSGKQSTRNSDPLTSSDVATEDHN
jgi:hypothetical protein